MSAAIHIMPAAPAIVANIGGHDLLLHGYGGAHETPLWVNVGTGMDLVMAFGLDNISSSISRRTTRRTTHACS
ncbi:hypothetical protein [Paraburkholderia sp. HP33-1]|uniref:hypothetical protein n=1 Tax=Paraburkholderia sp. HP33-1 TaxID=2883243 RepID=UPI001F2BFB25|nr:hypothetical protein [Paraburkholderia sp. HP33-1]